MLAKTEEMVNWNIPDYFRYYLTAQFFAWVGGGLYLSQRRGGKVVKECTLCTHAVLKLHWYYTAGFSRPQPD